ncbi:hypothetical protein ASD04_14410 [Devosia sp. Root436]|nr:hypothetical protein ASD04_14410 [Devosia sp. Root436]
MRLTIKTKLAATFVVVVALSAASMFLALQSLGQLNTSMDDIVNGAAAQSLSMREMQEDLTNIGSKIRSMIVSSSAEDMAQTRDELTGLYEELRSDAVGLVGQFSSEESNADMQSFIDALDQYWVVATQIQDEAVKNSDAEAFRITSTEGSAAITALEASMGQLKTTIAARLNAGDIGAFPAYDSATSMFLAASDIFRQQRNVLLASDQPAKQDEWLQDYRSVLTELEPGFAELGRLVAPTERGLFATVQSDYQNMIMAMDKAVTIAIQRSDYIAEQLVENEGAQLRETAAGRLEAMVERNIDELQKEVVEADELYQSNRMMLIGLLAGSALIAAIAATWIVMSISRALAGAVRLANDVAGGNLSATVQARGNDEVTDLIEALNSMTRKLREVVSEVTAATRNVAAGSQEMSATAEQLSQGATEQASSTEEASASMEEMASTIKQSADNAPLPMRLPRAKR